MSYFGVADNPPTYVRQIIIGICHALAFLTTVFRLTHRYRTHRLWWDDFWAALALVADVFVWILYIILPNEIRSVKSLTIQIFWKLGIILAYTLSLWSARISIGVTIVRLVTPGHFRTISKYVIYLFIIFYVTLSAQKIFMCGTRWKEVPSCPTPRTTAYQELATDLLADAWLIGAPAYILWKMKLSNRHRRLLMAIFSCGIFITFSSIAHSYFIVVKETVWVGITAHIQLGVSIVVCNLLVLVTFLYRVFRQNRDEDGTEYSGYNTSGRFPPDDLVAALSVDLAIRPSTHRRTEVGLPDIGPRSTGDLGESDNHSKNESRSCLCSSDFQLSFTDVATSVGSYPPGSGSERDDSSISRPSSKSTIEGSQIRHSTTS